MASCHLPSRGSLCRTLRGGSGETCELLHTMLSIRLSMAALGDVGISTAYGRVVELCHHLLVASASSERLDGFPLPAVAVLVGADVGREGAEPRNSCASRPELRLCLASFRGN